MKKQISRAMLEQLLEQYDIVDDVDEGMYCEDDFEDSELEESPVKPDLTPVAKLKARKIEDMIRQKAAGPDGDLEAVQRKIEKNKEKQAAELAAQKALDLEKRLGGKIFADSKQYSNLNIMKESYIKELRSLMENEVEQAGVLMAAKGFSQDIQTMIEKLGRLMNEELGPVVDNMRMAYGQQQAESFGQAMRTDMQNIMDTLITVKENIDDAVDELAAGQVPSMKNDMDGDVEGMDSEGFGGEEDMGDVADVDQSLDQIADDFGGDEAVAGPEEDPLGRPQKESVEFLKNQLVEMRKKLDKAKKLKERK
jgi:hypothetical protein